MKFWRESALFFVISVLMACSHNNYSPNLVATPYISEKGATSVSAHLGGLVSNNLDFQAAYNPAKQLTVMVNGFSSRRTYNQLDSTSTAPSHRNFYLEGGIGKWAHLGDETLNAGLFCGAGQGYLRNDYGAGRLSKLQYQKLFLQPTIVYRSEIWRIGMATRFAYLNYNRGNIDRAIPVDDLVVLMRLEQRNPFFMMETGLNVGLSFKRVTFSLNVVRTTMFGQQNGNDLLFDLSNSSLGLTVDLYQIAKHKKTAPEKAASE